MLDVSRCQVRSRLSMDQVWISGVVLMRSARDLSIASFDVEVSCSSADRSDRSHRALCFLCVALEPQSLHKDLMVDVTVLENISNIRIY